MNKVTKKELRQRCIDNETAIATLETLLKEHGITRKQEPKLKQLDQSAFEHPYVDERFNYAALNADGQAVFSESKPFISNCLDIWIVHTGSLMPMLKGYDASNWKNSLIEREPVELTGSDLATALLKNQRYIIASVSDNSDLDAIDCGDNRLIFNSDDDCFTDDMGGIHCYAVPLNFQGEPLTAADVGLGGDS